MYITHCIYTTYVTCCYFHNKLSGEDRGPVLEVIVSRTNFISSQTNRSLRIIGLSTALANAKDLADWLGIGQVGSFGVKNASFFDQMPFCGHQRQLGQKES